MSRLWMVRHGPTHVDGFVGWTDAPADLSDTAALGRLQAYLPQDAVVVSSDLQRAAKTADAIAGSRERLPHDPQLREMNFGVWEMQKFADIQKFDPVLAKEFWTNPGNAAPKGGESWNQTADRVAKALGRLMAAHPKRDLIVVVHIGVILTQLQRATKMDPSHAMSFVIDNLSVTAMETAGPYWRILGVNHKP